MGWFTDLSNSLTGGFVKEAGDIITKYLPPGISPLEKAQLQLELDKLAFEKQKQLDTAINEAEHNVNERIATYEGTASDLKVIPVFGPIMLFVRGSIRPLFCVYTLYMDYMVMSGLWNLEMGTVRGNVFVIMNTLVLGFHFGERALQNIMPLITNLVVAKTEKINAQRDA